MTEHQRTSRAPLRPLQEFIATEAAGGVALVVAALAGLLWANSPWSSAYFELLETHIDVSLPGYRLDEPLHFWVNDGLMVLFFLLVGLEIKRELVLGELNSMRRAAVPLAAALGGMVAPVAIFLVLARGAGEAGGWGVPMATDIAFALGVATLAGPRVPVGAKVLLLALATFDDIGAVLVIALWYSDAIEVLPLLLAAALLGGVYLSGRLRSRYFVALALLGVLAWAAVVKSGVHPTIVGVLLGLLTPARAPASASEHRGRSHLDRLEHALNPWVAFAIIPLFALANAGVDLSGSALASAGRSGVTWGVGLGLLVGKPVGVVVGTWIVLRLGARLPEGVGWRGVTAVGVVAGIGFTVALFAANLAYADANMVAHAKVGILAGSVVAGLLGLLLLRSIRGGASDEVEA